MDVPGYGMGRMESDARATLFAFATAMVCHLLFFAGLVFVPGYTPQRAFSPSVINVDIVTLPSYQEADRTASAGAAATTRPTVKVKQVETVSDVPATAPRVFRRKTSLKKKTYRATEVVKQAIARIEKKVETSRAEPVVRAIDDLRKTLTETGIEASAGDIDSPDGSSAEGRRAQELLDIYQVEIGHLIQKNWVFSEQLAGGRTDLIAMLVIEIQRDGFIRNTWFEKRSGNRYFDEQASKAVRKSNPLPSLPRGFQRSHHSVGLRFTPSGLE